MSYIIMWLTGISIGFFFGVIAGKDHRQDRICKEVYAAKVIQQIPTCKAWEAEIMGQLGEGK